MINGDPNSVDFVTSQASIDHHLHSVSERKMLVILASPQEKGTHCWRFNARATPPIVVIEIVISNRAVGMTWDDARSHAMRYAQLSAFNARHMAY